MKEIAKVSVRVYRMRSGFIERMKGSDLYKINFNYLWDFLGEKFYQQF